MHDMCHHVFMYDRRDKNTNSPTNGWLEYIEHTWRCKCKIKTIATR